MTIFYCFQEFCKSLPFFRVSAPHLGRLDKNGEPLEIVEGLMINNLSKSLRFKKNPEKPSTIFPKPSHLKSSFLTSGLL